MKITILDGNALNPGDLSWEPLTALGTLRVFARSSPEEVVERIGDSDAVLLNKIAITESVLKQCPQLRYIGVQATGYNVVDIAACKKYGVTVTNVPSYSTGAVAQLTFAFISEFACKTALYSQSVFAGDWIKSLDFCYIKAPLFELEHKTLGIFGYGHIGSRVAQIARAYGMDVLVCTRTAKKDIEHSVDFETLLKESDFLSLHAPLTEHTKEIINMNALKKMKKTAYLINTARGALVCEGDVACALNEGVIAGYAADVLAEEPMLPQNPLLKAQNCILTPHIAWAAIETRSRLLHTVAENLRLYIEGNPQNVVV